MYLSYGLLAYTGDHNIHPIQNIWDFDLQKYSRQD